MGNMLLVPVEVRQSPIHGLGVFAGAPIRKGTIVWQFDPGIDQRHPVQWLVKQPEHVRRYVSTHCVLSLDKQHYYIVGDYTLFVNHSLTPNLTPADDVTVNDEGVVVAARSIKPGEELTINYATIDGADQERLDSGQPLFEPQPVTMNS
jgi:uncharacterized protein